MQPIYWGFPLQDATAREARDRLSRIASGRGQRQKADNEAVAAIINQFVQEGLRAYYHEPVQRLQLSPTLRTTGDQSIRAVAGAMRMVVNGFFSGLNREDLLAAADYIEGLIWAPPGRDQHYLMFALDPGLGEALIESLNKASTGDLSHHEVRTLTHQLQQVVDLCMLHYYRHPADKVRLSKLSRKAADAGIVTVQRAFHSLLGHLLPQLNSKALARLADHLGTLINRGPADADE